MQDNEGISKSIYTYRYAIGAAALFGTSTPLAKLLLEEFQPITLAAFLYLGCGLGISTLFFARIAFFQDKKSKHPCPEVNDLPWLLGAIILGGIIAPIILLKGLSTIPAATASLLLNFEAAATTMIAFLIFREMISRKSISALILITAGGILLSLSENGAITLSLGSLAIIFACFMWGFENNLTCRISGKDPIGITAIKGLCAGSFSLILAILLGEAFPPPALIVGSMILGFFTYGLSIFLFTKSLNIAGAARTSSMFAASPFVGVIISWLIYPGFPDATFLAALSIMTAGAFFLFSENREKITSDINMKN